MDGLFFVRGVDRPLERRARLVNRHWCKWATEATQSLKLRIVRGLKVPTETRMEMISTKFKNLTQLDLSSCLGVTNRVLHRLVELPTLRALELRQAAITDEGLSCFVNSTSLKRLKLNICNRIEGWSLAKLSSLTSVDLSYCSGLTDHGFRCLGSLTSLIQLDMSRCIPISDNEPDYLTSPTARLELAFSEWDEFMFLSHLMSLRILNVSWTSISDTGLKCLVGLSSLVDLNLAQCLEITADGLTSLERLESIARLDLSGCPAVDDAVLRSVESLTSLTSLSLEDCRLVTDVGCELLSMSTSLVEVYIMGSKLATDEVWERLSTLENTLPFSYEIPLDDSDIGEYEYHSEDDDPFMMHLYGGGHCGYGRF